MIFDEFQGVHGVVAQRNLENAMFRFKNNIGPKLRARTSKRQKAEIKLGVHILNQMTRLGMSDSVRIS